MSVPKKLIKEVIARVSGAATVLSIEKFKTAKEFHWARNVINWKLTDYKNWTTFCSTHISVSYTTVLRYVTVINLVERFKYTDEECYTIITAIGWTRFLNGMFYMKRRMTPKGFIAKFKDWTTDHGARGYSTRDPLGDRHYSFSLPASVADIYDTWLKHYGMSTPDGGPRRNIRAAMIKLVGERLV
jgi:hypothetical protein